MSFDENSSCMQACSEDLSCSKTNTCRGCGHGIYDQCFLMVSQDCWHIQCLKCADCQVELENELTCFTKDGLVFCRSDYYRRYAAKRCATCSQTIDCAEMVMRARDCVFHLECFACVQCKRVLTTGDSFGMNDNTIYCLSDFQTFVLQKQTKRKKENGEGRSRKRKHEVLNCESLTFQDGCAPFGLDGPAHCGTKTKRVRTSFKQHQLLIMKTYFSLNHNPDSKDLKQLSVKTGLSKRVLQVWFQNARAKYRRVLTQGDLTEGHLHCELEQ